MMAQQMPGEFRDGMIAAAGVDAVRIKFGPTQHEALAQSPGSNTFYFDADRKVWKVMGEKETGAPVSERGLRLGG